jgi:hypothetical protein
LKINALNSLTLKSSSFNGHQWVASVAQIVMYEQYKAQTGMSVVQNVTSAAHNVTIRTQNEFRSQRMKLTAKRVTFVDRRMMSVA